MDLFCSSRKFWLITDVFHAGDSGFIIHVPDIGTKLLFIPYPAKGIALVNGKGFTCPLQMRLLPLWDYTLEYRLQVILIIYILIGLKRVFMSINTSKS